MRKVFFVLFLILILFNSCSSIPSSTPSDIPVNKKDSLELESSTIKIDDNNKVITIEGSIYLDSSINSWIKKNPTVIIVSITIIPLNDRYGKAIALIVYKEGSE